MTGKNFLLLLLLFQSGCMLLFTQDYHEAPVSLPDSFAVPTEQHEAEPMREQWWREFSDPMLNHLVHKGLASSPTLQQAWHRLAQAGAALQASRAGLFPQLNLSGSALRFSGSGRNLGGVGGGFGGGGIGGPGGIGGGIGILPGGTTDGSAAPEEFYFATPSLSYEVDLWGRILSQNEAAWLRREATAEDVRQTALVLSGNIANSWFSLLEQARLLQLITQQITESRTQLDLIELRFTLGSSTGVALLQQRQQLEAVEAELPQIESSREVVCHRLLVLIGEFPEECHTSEGAVLPELPPLPKVISPSEMLQRRPDLRALQLRLRAADRDVAAAVADRLPSLSLSLNYQFTAARFADLLDEWFRTLGANLSLPFIDGGTRRAEVSRREAVVAELLENLRGSFLSAAQEVQDALAQEKYQKRLVDQLIQQAGTLEQTVTRSRSRYLGGQGSYLDVVVARESLQRLERRIVSEKSRLLQTRGTLYRALGGGGWLANLMKEGENV